MHLKVSIVQLFQHSLDFQVTILVVKRVEVQGVYFAPSYRVIKMIFFTRQFHFVILSRIQKFFKFIAFLVILLSIKIRLGITMSKQDLQIYLKWKTDKIIYFLAKKYNKKVV